MQYALLEKLATDGHISATDKDRIYDTCSDLVTKVAFKLRNPFKKEQMPSIGEALHEQMQVFGKLLTRFALPAGLVGAGAYGSKILGEKVVSPSIAGDEAKKILKVKYDVLKMPEFSADPSKAGARFDEIARLAPAVAAKPELTARLIRGSLHSGFTSEDVQRLAQLQATYEKSMFSSSSSAENVQKALSKKASAMPPADAGRIAATVIQILAEAGLGEIGKTAAWRKTPFQKATTIAKQVLTTGAIVSGFGALVGLGAGTINQAADVYKKKKKAKALQASFYEAMKRSDPAVEPLHANKDKALQAFQTLTHFAPNVAADPEAARAFMLSLISMNVGAQVSAIKDLSEIEKNLKNNRGSNPFLEGLRAGTESVGMQGALGKTTGAMLDPFVRHSSGEISREMGY